MDAIQQLIYTFGDTDKLEFIRFVDRVSPKGQGMVVKLFELIGTADVVDKTILMEVLYGRSNYEAYKALRKRLLALLQRFIALKLIDSDSSNTSQVISTVNLARYLKGHQLDHLAFKFLQKGEKQAIDNDLYEVLNSIYILQIEYGEHLKDDEVKGILKKWKVNKERQQNSDKIEIALQLLTRKIRNQEGSLEGIVDEILSDIKTDTNMLSDPRFIYHIAALYRKQLMLHKDFFGLNDFLNTQYLNLQKLDRSKTKGNYYYVAFLYMLAHTAYRNRDFAQSQSKTQLLEKELEYLAPTRRKEFEVKLWLLRAAIKQYTGNIEAAISILENAKIKDCFKSDEKAEINRIVNLAVAKSLKGDYRSSKLEFLKISRTDHWLAKHFGEEWLLKKSMIEAILHFELGDTALLDSRLRYIKTKFKSLLQNPIYNKALVFVRFIEKLDFLDFNQNNKKLESEIENSFDFKPIEQEDLQAMVFYAWLKSKLIKKEPYVVLMDLLGNELIPL